MDNDVSRVALLLSLLRGLLGAVHPELRQASIEADEGAKVIRVRFEYDGEPSHQAWNSCSCAATEVIADFLEPWTLDDEHVAVPAPARAEALAHIAYRRWEPERRESG